MIPDHDTVATTTETQPSGKTVKRRSIVTDDATHNERLNRMAIRTTHAHDMLAQEARTFIVVTLIAALPAAIGLSLSHITQLLTLSTHR